MTNEYTHWRELMDPKFLRAECFAPGERKIVTIKKIAREEITNPKIQRSEVKTVAYFEEDVKPLVLNVTNQETIEKVLGTGNIYEWVGKKIQLFATKTRLKSESVPCIRVENVQVTSDKIKLTCCVCGKEIDEKTYKGSVAKYGKPYCGAECLKTDTEGKDLL